MTRARSDSQAGQATYRRSSIGGVIVLLNLAPRPLSRTDSGRRPPATSQQRCPLTCSRQLHLKSAPAHTNPDDTAVLKSP